MRVKVYLVLEQPRPGCEVVVAARLTSFSAHEEAKKKGGRSVRLIYATKGDNVKGTEDLLTP